MGRSRLNLFSISAALATLALVVTGAAVTSSNGQRFQCLHITVAIAITAVIVGLAISVKSLAARCTLLFALLAEILLGYLKGSTAEMLHAILAALLFAAVCAIGLRTSPSWQRDPEVVQDFGWPSLRSLSSAASFLIALQIGLGAGIRHSVVGVMPHLLGAVLTVIFIVIVSIFTMNQFPKHATLRPLASRLLAIAGVQAFLGMTVFLMRMMNVSGTTAWLAISAAHVANGSLTFAVSVMLAMEIRRDVRPRVSES
jgi:hypothetical protein